MVAVMKAGGRLCVVWRKIPAMLATSLAVWACPGFVAQAHASDGGQAASAVGDAPPAFRLPDDALVQRLRVGPADLRCVRAPCPTRGIWAVGEDGRRAGVPRHFLSGRPPLFEAVPDDRTRLEAAWTEGACLYVDGALGERHDGPLRQRVLYVERVIGPCRP